MTPGEDFIPYRTFRGALIPEGLLRFSGCCRGAAQLYGQLARYAGKTGVCFPGQTRLADDLRATERTVQRWTRQLVQNGLLRAKRRGAGTRTNSYTFVWSDLLGRQLTFDFGPHLAIVASNGVTVPALAVENVDNIGGRDADRFRAEFAGLVEKSPRSVENSAENPVHFFGDSRQECRVSDPSILIPNESQYLSRNSSVSVESESAVENPEPNTVRSVDEQSVLEEERSEATEVATETSLETDQERTKTPELTQNTTKGVREATCPPAAAETSPEIRRTVAGAIHLRSDRHSEGRQFVSAGDVISRFAGLRHLLDLFPADSGAGLNETGQSLNETAESWNETPVLRDDKVA